jgi:hypothetical protein
MKYENGFWIWKCDKRKLKAILLRDARGEPEFVRKCIGLAMDNAIDSEPKISDTDSMILDEEIEF